MNTDNTNAITNNAIELLKTAAAKQRAAENYRVAELRYENTPNRKNLINLNRARASLAAFTTPAR